MTDHDDADDPQLKSLRAVWLAMPDEEPPERGLAELMAAARVKADEMATPSLWQRIVALLRRPPVLALATVLVLVGGAVFIGQRRTKLEAEGPTVDQVPARDVATGSTPGVASGSGAQAAPVLAQPVSPAEEQREQKDDEPPALGGDTAKAEPAKPADLPKTERRPARPPRTAVKPPPTKPAETTTRGLTSNRDGELKLEAGRDKNLEDSTLREGGAGPAQGDQFASPQATTEAPADVKVGAATSHTAPPARASQYVQQAKTAAARGDCAAARTLMKRVAAEDAAAYRKALASDAALNKCFE